MTLVESKSAREARIAERKEELEQLKSLICYSPEEIATQEKIREILAQGAEFFENVFVNDAQHGQHFKVYFLYKGRKVMFRLPRAFFAPTKTARFP